LVPPERALLAIEIYQVSVILPTRVGAAALPDDAFGPDPAAQIGNDAPALLVCGRQPFWRCGIHGDRLGQRVCVMFAGLVSALAPGTGSAIESVAWLAPAGGGIPSRIGPENAFWRQTNGARPVEPIASDTGLFHDFTELLGDPAAMRLSLPDLCIA
jgi:hypothetical protein